LRFYGVNGGEDNGDFSTSQDKSNFSKWRGKEAPEGASDE